MSNVAKLKKQAAEFEAKKQFDKALAVYAQVLKAYDQSPDEVDLALFNRVGDLHLRQGNVADAVDAYERAVDKYAEGGFFNNAIALCNKILRQSPGRASVYYKLGKISAQKGFKADARQNFLEYAERMQKAGNMGEAFRALKEFADLCPDQDDIRLMLADQLTRAGKKDEAIEQLQTLYERYDSEGRSAEANATADRLRALNPSIQLRSGGGTRKAATDDLIFIDLGEPAPPRTSRSQRVVTEAAVPQPPPARPPAPTPASTPSVPKPARGTDPVFLDLSSSAPANEPEPMMLDVEPTAADPGLLAIDMPAGGLLDLESTNLGGTAEPPPSLLALDVESTSLVSDDLLAVEPSTIDLPLIGTPPAGTPAVESPDLLDFDAGLGAVDLDQVPPTPPPAPRRSTLTPRAAARAVDGLPLMDLDDSAGVAESDVAAGRPSGELLDLTLDDAPIAPSTPPPARTSGAADLEMFSLDGGTGSGADAPVDVPTTPPRSSTLFAARSVEILQAAVEGEPNDWGLRRELAEAMLEAGDRAGGIAQLEAAMQGAEDNNDLVLAGSLADELVLLEPDGVKHHQKRVEFAFRRNDRTRLVESYIALADVLLRSEQSEKARTVYERVLNLDPSEPRARAALDSLPPPPPPPPPADAKRQSSRLSSRTPTPQLPVAPPAEAPAAESFVNLGDWLRDDEGPKDTRMVVEEKEPTGDENADFADMLQKFKQGVAANVDAEDYQSHYDLAIAYKEMGLIDEAISGFQRALAGPNNRTATYEALGQCFIEKEKYSMATSILRRALAEPHVNDEKLLGVLYLLGRAAEAMGRAAEALEFYQRVFVLDIQFKDVADRMAAVEASAR